MAYQVPITVAFGVGNIDLTDAADFEHMEINIERGMIGVAIGAYGGDSMGGSMGNNMAVYLAVSVQDAFGVRCHGANDTAAAAAAGETEPSVTRLCVAAWVAVWLLVAD